MNYTEKNSQNANTPSKSFNDHTIIIEDKSSLLGNREIGKRYANLYKKYMRKQVAQYSLTVGSIEDDLLEKRRQKNLLSGTEFKLKAKNSAILKTINKSLCSCGRDPHFMNDKKIVDVKETATTRNLKGLKSCGNNSACPVCASKLSAIRGNQLKEMLDAGRENNRSYMMIVATIPHQPNEPLNRTLNQVIYMSKYIFNSRQFKEFKKATLCRFVHGGLENMVSFKNGLVDWHPHKNYLLDFDIPIKEVVERLGLKTDLDLRMYISKMMTELGQKYLDGQGVDKKLLQPFYQQEEKSKRVHVKGGVTASVEFDDKYITKWGLEAEMTSGIYKDGRFSDSFHPFNLLDFISSDNIEVTAEQKYQCAMAFQEFVLASRGKWWFYFGAGSVDYYNEYYRLKIKVKKDEEELLSLEDKGDLIYSLTFEEWTDFEPTPKKIGIALSLPAREDVMIYIYEHIEANRIKKAEDYYRSRDG